MLPSGPGCWYATYGSNTSLPGLRRYLAELDETHAAEARWVEVEHALYFAGEARAWGGPVAFLSLARHPLRPATCRAYRLTEEQLGRVFAGENGCGTLPPLAGLGLVPGEWHAVPMPAVADERLGKYDTVLRLPDVEGRAAYTFTTSRELTVGPPPPAYLDAIVAGLREVLGEAGARSYLARRTDRPEATNRAWISPTVRHLA